MQQERRQRRRVGEQCGSGNVWCVSNVVANEVEATASSSSSNFHPSVVAAISFALPFDPVAGSQTCGITTTTTRPRRPRRTRSPRARERREPPSIVTSSQSPPPLPSSCSRPVAVVTAIAVDSEWSASSPLSCCRWGRRAATLLGPPVPVSLPLLAGRSPRSSSPHASKPSRPDAASAAPARAHLVRGRAHGASAAVAAAAMPQSRHRQPVLDPPSLLGPPPPVLGGIAGQKWREGSGVVIVLCTT